MENKAKYLHSNNEKKEEWPSKKTNDVFISYRRASSTEANQRHSTSLARSIALELKSEGFTVYFDCWSNKNDYLENIKKSKYFFVLLTGYSWEKGDNKKRSNFEEEIAEIEKGIENGNIDKDNVWWIDIDKSASNKKPNDKEFEVLKRKFHIDDISTKKESLIKDFIDVPKNGNRRIIRKFPRFSHKQCEIFSWFFALLLPISIVMGYMLYQYSREKVIFAGGGTVQQYLHDSLKIDVDDFQLGSEYIHLPSTTAWQLLWDDINEDQPRQYCPIILSTH